VGESCDESVRRARIFLDRGRSCCRSFGWCGGRDSGDFSRIGCLHVSLIYLSLDYSHFFESTIKTIVARREDPTWSPSSFRRRLNSGSHARDERELTLVGVYVSVRIFAFFDSFLFTGDSAYLVRKLLGRTLKFRRIQVCDVLVYLITISTTDMLRHFIDHHARTTCEKPRDVEAISPDGLKIKSQSPMLHLDDVSNRCPLPLRCRDGHVIKSLDNTDASDGN
jgi:hypothetical protein